MSRALSLLSGASAPFGLGTNLLQPSGSDPVQRGKYRRHEWLEILNPIGPRHHQHHAEWQGRQILLALKFAVHRDERINLAARTAQEFAVFHARPTHALNGDDVVA